MLIIIFTRLDSKNQTTVCPTQVIVQFCDPKNLFPTIDSLNLTDRDSTTIFLSIYHKHDIRFSLEHPNIIRRLRYGSRFVRNIFAKRKYTMHLKTRRDDQHPGFAPKKIS